MFTGKSRNVVVCILLLFALAGGKLIGAEVSPAELEPLFRRIIQSNPAAASIPGAFVEAPELWDKSEGFKKLEGITQKHWREMLDHLDTIAPTPVAQVIFFQSAHSLNRSEYVAFLNRAADLLHDKILHGNGTLQDGELLTWNLFPEEEHLRGFIQNDYRDPGVRQFLVKYREIFASDPSAKKFADDTIAGLDRRRRWIPIAAVSSAVMAILVFLGVIIRRRSKRAGC